MLTGLKLSGQRKKWIKFVPVVLWLSLSLFEIEILQSLEESWQTSVQYNITAVKKRHFGNYTAYFYTCMSYSFSSCMVFCISCSVWSKNKSRSHTHFTEFLEIFVHPRRPTEYPPPFLFILPEFGKRYLQEEFWQRGQSINQASGIIILKELCLISESGMIEKKLHKPWNNNKEHCPCYQMQKFAEKVQPVKIWICQINLHVMPFDIYCLQKYHNYCFNGALIFWVTFKTQYCQQKNV